MSYTEQMGQDRHEDFRAENHVEGDQVIECLDRWSVIGCIFNKEKFRIGIVEPFGAKIF